MADNRDKLINLVEIKKNLRFIWSRPYVLVSVWKSVHFNDLSQPVVFKTPADTWRFLLKKSDLRICPVSHYCEQ